MSRSVRVLSTGGTIASTGGDGGATSTRGGSELVDGAVDDAVDGVGDVDLAVEEVAQVLSFELGFDAVTRLARRARAAARGGADGVVVTHGTDTMEESAYYLDLGLDLDAPVVFTGAQRRADEPGADGPANLRTAIRAATDDALAGAGGVYVAFDRELHAARDAVKVHTYRLGAFASPGAGPVATFPPGGRTFHRAPGSRSVHLPGVEVGGTVVTVPSGIGATGEPVQDALAAGADGIVLEGTGLGNVSPGLAEAATDATERGVPVVVTSRCHEGAVAPVYDTEGGGKTLAERGAILAGDLPAGKARIKLLRALDAAAAAEAVDADTADTADAAALDDVRAAFRAKGLRSSHGNT